MSTPLANQPPPPTPGKRWLIGFAIAAAVILPIIVLATIYEPNGGAQDDGPARNPVTRDRADGYEIRAYCLENAVHWKKFGEFTQKMNRQFDLVTEYSTLLLDDDWQQTTVTYLIGIDNVADEMLAIDAPYTASVLHNMQTTVAYDLKKYADLTIVGIRNLDASKITEATELRNSTIDRMRQITIMARSLCQR